MIAATKVADKRALRYLINFSISFLTRRAGCEIVLGALYRERAQALFVECGRDHGLARSVFS